MKPIKIIYFGTPDFSAKILGKLITWGAGSEAELTEPELTELCSVMGNVPKARHSKTSHSKTSHFVSIVTVVTQPNRPVGRKQVLTPSPVKLAAQKRGLPVLTPTDAGGESLLRQLSTVNCELIIVAAYGQILPPEILALPRRGCLNLHFSLLPKYRGASPVQAAILNGDAKTGVTIIKMDEKMDHGPIIAQAKCPIAGDDTAASLTTKLAELGADLLIKTVPDWAQGKVRPKPQNHAKATYTKLLKREDGRIDWSKPDAEIERMVRAYYPWPGTFTEFKGKRLKILKAHLEDGKLKIDKVQPEGKEPTSFEGFKKGCRLQVNNKLTELQTKS